MYRFSVATSKYFYLLIILVSFFLGTSILTDMEFADFPVSELFSLIVLSSMFIVLRERILIFYAILLGCISILSHIIIGLFYSGKEMFIVFYLTNIAFLILITVTILRSITVSKEITADTLFGAICGYFMLGLVWSFVFLLIGTIYPGSFKPNLITNLFHHTEQNAFYFSFVTMTTIGYGDILPITNTARLCAWLEAVTGEIYLAVWIAQLVGLRIAQKG